MTTNRQLTKTSDNHRQPMTTIKKQRQPLILINKQQQPTIERLETGQTQAGLTSNWPDLSRTDKRQKDLNRPSNTGFGIWDLPQKSSTKAKFGTLGLNWDFFGTIFIPFCDF